MNQILYANDYQTAVTEIEAAGGRVLQQFSERVFVAFLPDTYALETLQSSSQQAGWTLSRQEQLLVNSWQRFQDRKQTPVERDTHSWDAMGFEYPRNPSNDPDLARELLGLQQLAELGVYVQTDTSKVMRGSATIGLLLVSGPTKNLQLSNDEIMHAISQVNEGAQLLIEAEPRAALSFSYRVDEVTVTAPDKPALYRDIYFIFPLPNASSLFLFWQSEAGWAAVRPINHYPSGNLVMPATSEQWSVIWDPDYRLYMPFVLNGNQYFLSSNIVNGSTNIRQITYDPTTQLISVADPAWSVTGWNPDYRVYMPFVLKGNQYFLTTNADNGNAYIRQISLGASGKIVVSEPVWNDPGWNPEYTV
jgi:hypothetical protein